MNIELSEKLKNRLNIEIIGPYSFVSGTHESTMLEGIAHGITDSGILEDGMTPKDVKLQERFFTEEAIESSTMQQQDAFLTHLYLDEEACNGYKACRVMDQVEAIMQEEYPFASEDEQIELSEAIWLWIWNEVR